MTNPSFQVALDGPAASGKSTVARMLAKQIGGYYINTGDMYRTLAWHAISLGIRPDAEPEKVVAMLKDCVLQYRVVNGTPQLFLNDQPVPQSAIRAPEIAANASVVARIPALREWMLQAQRDCASLGIIIMEGRDIATVIFPQARFKFFVTASPLERARRRLAQSGEVPEGATLESVAESIRQRDLADSSRPVAPLKPAPDSILIQTDGLTAEEVTQKLADTIHAALA